MTCPRISAALDCASISSFDLHRTGLNEHIMDISRQRSRLCRSRNPSLSLLQALKPFIHI